MRMSSASVVIIFWVFLFKFLKIGKSRKSAGKSVENEINGGIPKKPNSELCWYFCNNYNVRPIECLFMTLCWFSVFSSTVHIINKNWLPAICSVLFIVFNPALKLVILKKLFIRLKITAKFQIVKTLKLPNNKSQKPKLYQSNLNTLKWTTKQS